MKQVGMDRRRLVVRSLLDDFQVPGIADEEGAVLVARRVAEGQVGAQDGLLVAVLVLDHVQRDVRVGGLHVVVHLDVVILGPADDLLLLGFKAGII